MVEASTTATTAPVTAHLHRYGPWPGPLQSRAARTHACAQKNEIACLVILFPHAFPHPSLGWFYLRTVGMNDGSHKVNGRRSNGIVREEVDLQLPGQVLPVRVARAERESKGRAPARYRRCHEQRQQTRPLPTFLLLLRRSIPLRYPLMKY
jgi:hypothetical protein